MKGGVVPLNLVELQDRLSRVRAQYANRFPVQSQHEGNCASDAIQIILFFSDGIGKRFARQAIREFQDIRNDDIIYNEEWITNQLSQVQSGANLFRDLGDIYARITAVRYLRLIDEYEQRLQPTGFGLARTESQGASIERPGVRTPIGVVCSSVFAVANRRLDTPTAILARRGARNMLYGYSQENYDPIVNRVLQLIAPEARLLTGTLSGREEGNVDDGFRGIYEPTRVTNELRRMTGVQFFFIENSINQELGRTQRGFHTLSFFKHGGNWFIGDNEVGFAIPLPANITTEFILSHSFSFVATAPDRPDPNGLYRYERIYYSHEIEIDGLLQPGVVIGRANYFLTSPTSGTYLPSYENVGSPNQFPMPRKYFIPPPQRDVWGEPDHREQPLARRIFPADMQFDFTDRGLVETVGLEGYLVEGNSGDRQLWNQIPASVRLYSGGGAGGSASEVVPVEKTVIDGIYGIRITRGGTPTRYKLNRTPNGRQDQQYFDVNGITLYIEPIGAPAAAPARPRSEGVAMFAEARRVAREARSAATAPVATAPLGFGFPGTTPATTVVRTAPTEPPGGVYGFINPAPEYIKSTDQAPPGFSVGAGLTLIAPDNRQANVVIQSFMIEPTTNDVIVVVQTGPTEKGAYKIARNAQNPTVRLRTTTGVFLAQPSDETLRWVSQSLAPAAAVAPTGDFVKTGEPIPPRFAVGSAMVLTDLQSRAQVNGVIQTHVTDAQTGDLVLVYAIQGQPQPSYFKIARSSGRSGVTVATPYDVYLAGVNNWGGSFTLANPTAIGPTPSLFGRGRRTRRARKSRPTRRRR